MKLENLTSLQTQLFKLPVVFTECAWYEAVYLEQPASFGDLDSRLGDTLEAAYTCLFYRTEKVDAVEPFYDFGLYRFLPNGDQADRHWLELRLTMDEHGPVVCMFVGCAMANLGFTSTESINATRRSVTPIMAGYRPWT